MKTIRYLLLTALAAGAVMAQPSINLVENAASNLAPGLPNAAVAQGSMLVLKGAKMGPTSVVVASSFPLQTTLAGTSVKVTVGGASKDCILYYSLDFQVACILPSSTPAGTGTVTVTYNGQTSASAPITVVANNIAIYTLDSSGTGAAVATFQVPPSGGPYVSPSNAAKSGDTVILWANGLGPVNSDESRPAVQADQSSVPLEVYIGGKQATVLFRGRNGCCSSVDTIYVAIPAGVTGCVTPVTMKIGNLVSNTATLPLGTSGKNCTATQPGVSDTDISRFLGQGTISFGGVFLSRTIVNTASFIPGQPPTTTRSDDGSGFFAKVNFAGSNAFASGLDISSYGACIVTTYSGQTAPPSVQSTLITLDAGPSIGVNGPAGSKTLAKSVQNIPTIGNFISYGAKLGAGVAGNYLDAGAYTFTGPGGPDVGSFTARLTLPATLTWTNAAAVATVVRANGATVTWTGGDPAGYVQISGNSTVVSDSSAVFASFTCNERTSVGQFTVPPVVLLALPASTSIQGFALPGSMTVSGVSTVGTFTATGIDYGSVSSSAATTNSVTFQ